MLLTVHFYCYYFNPLEIFVLDFINTIFKQTEKRTTSLLSFEKKRKVLYCLKCAHYIAGFYISTPTGLGVEEGRVRIQSLPLISSDPSCLSFW